ncbi:sporulation protein [Thermomonospora curvata]|uniref:SpoOM family protein n=1 Tax=Thermomonospora curvata (strain ATCC 19995 / DSM 43183 / JCM 3096 / KCTC 9072 / NBRC 15933 / NCIMB 10081 / Henssen B9) TaxID=471852 RepID=D1A7E8_THECD|nr:sporulation protein [Thermomonospora curvata]ACY96537.1 SpoOM family protein [Thermomonospora curvata DSM 43183]
MIFRQMLGAFGVGGPSVETVLTSAQCRPGEILTGEVRLQGGEQDAYIDRIVLSLVTEAEFEHDDHEGTAGLEFHQGAITGGFVVGAHQFHTIPFQVPLPWELPITQVYGRHLDGMVLGVRTEVEVAGQLDKGDLDPIAVTPLPSQQRVLDAFAELGFVFKNADLEYGQISGLNQQLPFYQEIEFYAPPQYSGHINEVELTFVTDPHHLVVVLEADRRGDLFSEGEDVYGRLHVPHDQALYMAWEHEITNWLQAVIGRLSGGHVTYGHHEVHGGHAAYGHHEVHGGHGSHGHFEGHGGHGGHGGPGWAGVAAGAAAGFVAGAVVNELLDDDSEEEEEQETDVVEAAQAAAYEAAYQVAYQEAIEEAVEDAYEDAYEAAYEAAYEEAYEEASEIFEDED